MNRYEWWIDYLEGEVTSTERLDMDVLLKFSNDHRSVLAGLERTRDCIKRLDPVSPPSGESFYAGLHASIMDQIDQSLSAAESITQAASKSKNSHQNREA